MAIPGLTDELDPALSGDAEEDSQKLLADLKEKVAAEIKDVGTLRKEMAITVPAEVISERLKKNYDELRSDAIVPGFRKGRAPLQLIQKRFGPDVRDSLKTMIIGQSFFAAAENNEIDALGDPLFRVETKEGVRLAELNEAMQHIELPESGDLRYVCEVEVKPKFELPELKGVEIKDPQIVITDDMLENSILRQRKVRGRYEPLSDGAAQVDDLIVADAKLTVDGVQIKDEANLQLGVRATRLDGIPLPELDQTLAGVRPGDERSTDCQIPDDYERPDLRGKQGKFEFKIHEVKRLAPIPMEAFAEQSGFESEQELRAAVREDMELERNLLVERALREQVLQYLLDHTTLDVPEKLSARQTDRAVLRRVVELQQAGAPVGEIEKRIDELRTSATEEVARELKLEFILEKVAEQLEVDVTDEEVNSEIAVIARRYNSRFDRIRDDMHRRGLLAQLAEQIRQDKCVRVILGDGRIVAVQPDGEEAEGPAEGPAEGADEGAEKKKAPKKKAAKNKTAKKKQD